MFILLNLFHVYLIATACQNTTKDSRMKRFYPASKN